jgi:hypothetical protein
MEDVPVPTGAQPFSRLILTSGDEDVNFDYLERELGFRFFRRLSIRVKNQFSAEPRAPDLGSLTKS